MRCFSGLCLNALLRSAGFHMSVDIGLDRGQAPHGMGLEIVQEAEAAGTRIRMIVTHAGARETSNGPGDHGGRGRCAGARASQAQIRLMRRQQRHKSNPKYGPENHCYACSFWYANSMPAGLFRALKSFAKFETSWRFIALSSQ
jgi:hypothetical protein